MKAETADYLAKARATLADAQQIASLPLPHIAARGACLAVFHAAEAYVFEPTGKVAKTHWSLRTGFARLASREPRIGRDLMTPFTAAYQAGTGIGYDVSSTAATFTPAEAIAVFATPLFIDRVADVLLPTSATAARTATRNSLQQARNALNRRSNTDPQRTSADPTTSATA